MIRVFPRKTNSTPDDEKVFFTGPPLWDLEDREVHVSCTFTWDKTKAEAIACQWKSDGYNVSLGGPAYDARGEDFVPGRYLKDGFVFTSRGCNNRCWFCLVPRREGNIRELPIRDGWNILDSNLLQCSEEHIESVFAMLKRQRTPVVFSGGLDASLLSTRHVDLLLTLRIKRIYLAYDTEDDYEPLLNAAKMLSDSGILGKSKKVSVYVLTGYPRDYIDYATRRIESVMELGMVPYVNLYRDESGRIDQRWITFRRDWVNRKLIYGRLKALAYDSFRRASSRRSEL